MFKNPTLFNSFGYNDPEHFMCPRVSILKGIKMVWNENKSKCRIVVKNRGFFNQLKELALEKEKGY